MAVFVLKDKKFNGVISGRQFKNGETVEPVPESQVELVARILCRYHGATVEGTDLEIALASPHVAEQPEPEKVEKTPKEPKEPTTGTNHAQGAGKPPASL